MDFNSSLFCLFVSLLLAYDSIAPNTKHMLALMNGIAEKRKGYYNFVLIDCNTDDKEVLEEFIYCND